MNNKEFCLSYARFRFTMAPDEESLLPPYLGSTLRGAMGHALRQMVCLHPRGNCQNCMHRWQCAFFYIMATSRQETDSSGNTRNQTLPHPYVIEPPAGQVTSYSKGDSLVFHLLLIGNGIALLPLFIAAFERVGKNGLGKGRYKYSLKKVEQVYHDRSELLWAGGNNLIQAPVPIGLNLGDEKTNDISKITLHLHTPLRLVDKGRLEDTPDFSVFMRAVFRRIDSLGRIHGQGGLEIDFHNYLDRALQVKMSGNKTRWHDWERYSSTQASFMKLGGLIGEISYEGKLGPFLPFIKMSEILHVGKGSSFGLGRYSLVTKRKINDI